MPPHLIFLVQSLPTTSSREMKLVYFGTRTNAPLLAPDPHQWSFRGGTRANAVPIVKIPWERMGTAFPLLIYGENVYILLKMHFAVKKMFS